MGGHHSARSGTVEWLTPPEIIAALGPFDLDPCAPINQPYPTAALTFTALDNGLRRRWPEKYRVWLNPPYTQELIGKWLARMAEHDRGTALIFARTETEAFQRYVFARCSALLFMKGRINFHLPDGSRSESNAGAPTVLCAYGREDADILAACDIAGHFQPLRIPVSVFVSLLDLANKTWHAEVGQYLAAQDGPVALAQIYRDFAKHPKALGNPTYQATIRRTLQEGAGARVQRGLWEASGAS